MKKHIIFSAFIIIALSLNAQQSNYYSYTLKHTTPLKAKICYQGLKNIGEISDTDIDAFISKKITDLANDTYTGSKKAKSANVWLIKPTLSLTDNESEADVVISGTYKVSKGTISEEKFMYETSSNYTSPIPYFDLQTTNKVEIEIIFNYLYKDKSTLIDTMLVSKEDMRKPRKKFKSIEELEESCQKSLKLALYKKFDFIDRKATNYKLPKVKVKDKALKAEYKTAGDLLKSGDIMKLGSIYQRIYDTEPSKEAAYCLGVCYELIGNFPKAQELYNQMPDFHTKVRIKNSRKLYDYLLEIGVVIDDVEF
ncbi:MAG: hypothetical protein GQ527_05860 [Bacteroidales bacterium]|nr:hypothetical protein [Bacteroidales bacterium]